MRITKEQLEADVAFLSERANRAGCFYADADRAWGISSNAIVRLAYGGRGPASDEMPMDRSDFAACVRAVAQLPAHRHTPAVDAALDIARRAVAVHEAEHEARDCRACLAAEREGKR